MREEKCKMTSYSNLRNNYGQETVTLLKKLTKTKEKLVKQINRRNFLLRCRTSDLLPNFLKFNTFHIQMKSEKCIAPYNNKYNTFLKSILNLLITDTIIEIKNLQKLEHSLTEKLSNILSKPLMETVLETRIRNCEKLFIHEKSKLQQKFQKLELKEKETSERKKPDVQNWLINDTNVNIPEDVQEILCLGKKFATSWKKSELPVDDVIASIETGLDKKSEGEKNEIREIVSNLLITEKNKQRRVSKEEKSMQKKIQKTKKFIAEHKELIITTADKSKKTVILKKEIYEQKMESLLDDKVTYKKINKDLTAVTQRKNNEFINKLADENLISLKTTHDLKRLNALPPKIYGMPKTHKIGTPLRPVVSCIQSPTYNLEKYLSDILKHVAGQSEYNLKNSWDFVKDIKTTVVPTDYIIISLDVVSMYTSIPKQLVIETITKKWKDIKQHTIMSKNIFIEGIQLCLNANYFKYKMEFFEQINGLPMGAPLSAILANLVLEELETDCLNKINLNLPFYRRYVDDIFMIVPKNSTNYILTTFNNYNKQIQFTLEIENNNQLNFLDVSVKRENHCLTTAWYTKPTWSGRYMSFNSEQPSTYKKNVVTNLVSRAISLTNPKDRMIQLKKVKQALKTNSYPEKMIDSTIKKETYKYYNNGNNNNPSNQDKSKKTYVSLPYIKHFSEKLKKSLTPYDLIIAHKNSNNLSSLYTHLKAKTEVGNKTHTVYQINCNNCAGNYIGQSKQYLKTRIKRHENSITGKNSDKTALRKHAEENNHTFNFNNVKILKQEENEKKRLVYEMINIKRNNSSINDKRDVENLSYKYNKLLKLN